MKTKNLNTAFAILATLTLLTVFSAYQCPDLAYIAFTFFILEVAAFVVLISALLNNAFEDDEPQGLPDEFELTLIAADFNGTVFCNNQDCAISRAVKRTFNGAWVNTALYWTSITLNSRTLNYEHALYGCGDFDKDARTAAKWDYNPAIAIRKITLTKRA